MKIKNKLVIEKSKEPVDTDTHILYHISETLRGYNCRRIFKGSYYQCLKKKEELTKDEKKPKTYSFRLLREALHHK